MKRNYQLNRAKKILESDRLGLQIDAENLIRRDIESLLGEYFNLKKPPFVTLDGESENIVITVEAVAKGVKRFNVLK